MVDGLPGRATLNSGVFRVRVDPERLEPAFLYYVLRSRLFDRFIEHGSTGSTIEHLYQREFVNFPYPRPPLQEQRAIARYLDGETARIDALIAQKLRMIELVELRRSQALEQALRLRGCSLPESLDHECVRAMRVPPGWRVPKLSNILRQLTNGYVGPTRDILREEGVRYIQGLHVKNGEIDFDRRPYYVEEAWHRARPRTALRPNDVVIVQTGDIGQCAVIPEDFGEANCHALLIARCEPRVATGPYLATYLQSHFGRHSLLRLATGALHPHLEFGIRDARIVLPPLHEQQKIVQEVRRAQHQGDQLVDLLRAQLDLLLEHREALITAAVTGELNIAEAA